MAQLRITLQICEEGGQHVHYKFDGKRFGDVDETTLKLHEDKHYKLVLACSRPATLRPETCMLYITQGVTDVREFPLDWQAQDEGRDAGTRSSYSCAWKCELPKSAKSGRWQFEVRAHVEDFGLVALPLLVKIYGYHDASARHGFPLRQVQYDLRQDSSGAAKVMGQHWYRY